MGPSSLAWLLRLAAFCHLCAPLAGQHFSMSRCSNDCKKMTSQIPLRLLHSYKPLEESCKIRAIVLETSQHRHFCADPKEKWVQQAMEYLDNRDTALTQNGGKFEKRVGQVTPRTTLSTKGLSLPALVEPEATVEGLALEITSSQEARRPMGTSPELPVAVTESLRTGSPPTSRAQDAGPTAGPRGTEIFKAAAVSTTIWQSSATYQSGSGLWAEEKATELPTTTAPSTQAPTTLHQTPEENIGSAGQPQWVQGQSPSPENFLEPADMNGTHTDALQNWGPDNTAQPSVAPVSSEGTPSRELGSSGSWPPKIEEPIQATADPQKLSVLITPVPDSQAATRRQAVGLLAFLGLLFCLGVGMFAYQSLQGCPRKMAGEMVEGLRYVPRSCGSNSYVLVPV